MYALVDCNNFYVSCERLFRPDLKGRPVLVLSNNDGMAISRSLEVKQLGVPMGMPWFQMQELARKHGIVAFSSNYALYADISSRVMKVLRDMAPRIEVYSIDESFVDMAGIIDPELMAKKMRQRVDQWVGIPVCVGIGSTKTRAKLANHIAKKNAYLEGVFNLETQAAGTQDAWLQSMDVAEVWGIGRQLSRRLQAMAVNTVYDLQKSDPVRMRKQFNVNVARTVEELRGHSCLELETMTPTRQQIMVSRSFGEMVTQLDELREPVVTHATRASEKLRQDGSVTQAVMVFVQTNRFREQDPQYTGSQVVPLETPTQNSQRIISAAVAGLNAIYRPGYQYKKAGVMLCDLSPVGSGQSDLFAVGDDDRSQRLMQTLDKMNQKMGRDTVFFAGQGIKKRWNMRRDMKSPAYTTQFDQLPTVS